MRCCDVTVGTLDRRRKRRTTIGLSAKDSLEFYFRSQSKPSSAKIIRSLCWQPVFETSTRQGSSAYKFLGVHVSDDLGRSVFKKSVQSFLMSRLLFSSHRSERGSRRNVVSDAECDNVLAANFRLWLECRQTGALCVHGVWPDHSSSHCH